MTVDSGHDGGGSREQGPTRGVGLLRDVLKRAPAGSVPREAFLDSYRFLLSSWRRDVEVHLVRGGLMTRDVKRANAIRIKIGDDATLMNTKAGENPAYKAELARVSTAVNKMVEEADAQPSREALEREISRIGQSVDWVDLEREFEKPGTPLGFLRLGRALTTIENVTKEELGFNPYEGEPEGR